MAHVNRSQILSTPVGNFDNCSKQRFVVVSYNLHGFNQGSPGVKNLINVLSPEIIMVQEHWLYPSNLSKLNDLSSEYISFGSSAMADVLGSGPFYGRPYGGTATLVKREFAPLVLNIISNDRLTAIKLSNWIVVNVYMPCSGTPNRQLLYSDILQEILALMSTYSGCNLLIGGDFNVNLDCHSSVSDVVNGFLSDNNMVRCDVLFPVSSKFTYVNEALNNKSTIDYFVTSSRESTVAFNVLDLDLNLSDHLPIMAVCLCELPKEQLKHRHGNREDVSHFRWDHAPLPLYYDQTRVLLQPILDELNLLADGYCASGENVVYCLDRIYNSVVDVLRSCANMFVPKHTKKFTSFGEIQSLMFSKKMPLGLVKFGKQLLSLNMGRSLTAIDKTSFCIKSALKNNKAAKRRRLLMTCMMHCCTKEVRSSGKYGILSLAVNLAILYMLMVFLITM